MEMRSQSAMEYLMTYGWAILIIAVILGVLFSLGVFNPTNYAPKVPAGNCHVFRPNGPGTNFNVNLVGTCSGFLPQYVAQFNGHGYSNMTNTADLNVQTGDMTVGAWVYILGPNSGTNVVSKDNCGDVGGWMLIPQLTPAFRVIGSTSVYTYGPSTISANSWYYFTGVKAGNSIHMYVNGVSGSPSAAPSGVTNTTFPLIIGGRKGSISNPSGCGPLFNGSIANVQVYNASLDANEIQYLYNEGIGGAPIYLSHLVGWWPLNGDTKDYSGNGYDGTPTNISFNGSWTSGYTQP